jgi:hypothetical protein
MFEYDVEAEFENAWDKMIQKYNVGSVSWLNGWYIQIEDKMGQMSHEECLLLFEFKVLNLVRA